MAFALTKFQAYGFERDEALTNKFHQALVLSITGLNTDIDLDIGDYSGTFWTAVGATAPGINALKTVQDIQVAAESFDGVDGTSIAGKAQVDASGGSVLSILSAVSAGGNATETMTVTGLLTTDDILAVTQAVDGAGAATGILAYGNATGQAAANNALSVTWNADPGAGARVKVGISRTTGVATPVAGTYTIAMDGTNTQIPNLLFASGDAPTSYVLVLKWVLKNGHHPASYTQSA